MPKLLFDSAKISIPEKLTEILNPKIPKLKRKMQILTLGEGPIHQIEVFLTQSQADFYHCSMFP